jgi:hypothetical protein
MLLQLAQPTLTNVFQLTKKIEMNIMEERVVILGFSKKNPRNSLAPSGQLSRSQPTKVGPLEAKGTKLDFCDGSTSYSTK